jgi:hypothetical protein
MAKSWWWIIVGVGAGLVLAAGVVGVVYFRRRTQSKDAAEPSSMPTPVKSSELQAVRVVRRTSIVPRRGPRQPRKRGVLIACSYTSNQSAIAKDATLQATSEDVRVLREVLTRPPLVYPRSELRCRRPCHSISVRFDSTAELQLCF